MQRTSALSTGQTFKHGLLSAALALLLGACGGGAGGDSVVVGATAVEADATAPDTATLASGTTVIEMELGNVPDEVADQILEPSFHIAPALLSPPDDADRNGSQTSASHHPQRHVLSAAAQELSTRQLSPHMLASTGLRHLSAAVSAQDASLSPMAIGSSVSVFTPAQIRAAYGLPSLPPAGTTPSASQAAQLGAGQTIYVIAAKHNPNVAAELAAFNQKFGLPTCTALSVPVTSTLPLAAAPVTGCQLALVYSTSSGTLSSATPAYDPNWATEISLDVQWAHATAPLARIVLIEAPDASLSNLLGGIKLANAMGPGVVSMSFGTMEGSWTANADSVFNTANMTYLAATGDSGAAVSWPAVSNKVLAVGGTSLTYTGTGGRSEVAWSKTGGGTSLYTVRPAYQTAGVPGMTAANGRSVADVAFNADPATGQFVAVMVPGSTAVNWVSGGGTSLATPQWAGLVAIANAMRATSGKAPLGTPHSVLYGQIASVPGVYAGAFADITKGLNGSCSICTSVAGYDAPSGLGTPNVPSLLAALTGASAPVVAPVVTSANIAGRVGTALTFTASVTASNPVTFSLSNAPAGMAIDAAGVVTWAAPVSGSYSVSVSAKDAATGAVGNGVYTVNVAAPVTPTVASATVNGVVGTALAFTPTASSSNPLGLAISGAPVGMTMGSSGVVTWPTPAVGTYVVKVTAKDNTTGLSATGTYTIVIAAATAPVVKASAVTGKPGISLSFTPTVTATNPLSFTLSGAPPGMTVAANGQVTWPSPVKGSYSVTVVAKDNKTGLMGQAVYTVSIASAGPVITAAPAAGIVGNTLSGNISIADPSARWLSISISGAPLGMSLSASGQTITYKWTKPVAGSYTLKVSVVDNAGLSAQSNVAITVAAK